MNEQTLNLNQAFLEAMDRYADRPCFLIKRGGRYQSISYRRFQELTFRMVRFLQRGTIAEGERVAITTGNSLEWMVAYMATLLAGGVAMPLRHSLTLDTLRFTLHDSGACTVVLSNEHLIQTVSTFLDETNEHHLPHLRHLLTVTELEQIHPGVIPIPAILAEADPLLAEERAVIHTYAMATAPETLAVIHYSAGETGRPKGAVFDHARLVRSMRRTAEWLTLGEDDLAFTVVPWSYAASLNVALFYFLSGVPNVLAESGQTVLENMAETSPTVTLSTPHFLEQLYGGVLEMVDRMPESGPEVFQWAVAKGREFRAAGPKASPQLREEYARADMTFFSRFRGQIGGRMRCIYSVGAPLPQNLAGFFEAIGLPVFNCYSLTEAGGFPAVSRFNAQRPGSCGQTAPGFQVCLADDGEVLIHGETVMAEYWGWPLDMYQVLDAEGWLHTGDLGRFDDEGYLYLIGRKRPFMVLSTGRKILPDSLEQALMASPLIDRAIVFGEGRPYVSALIVPDLEALGDYFSEDEEETRPAEGEEGSTDLMWFWPQDLDKGELLTTTAHPSVKAMLDRVMAEVNRRVDRWERIEAYSLLDQAHSETAHELAELAPAQRHRIAERYAFEIEAMYPPKPLAGEQEVTRVGVSPERMRELLEKESILDAWLADAGIEFLFNLARSKGIDAPSMVHVCDAAATIAQTESEEKPLSTAIIVGDPVCIGRILPPSQIQLLRHDHIRRLSHALATLARLVDGYVLGYVVDKHGYVRGVHRLMVNLADTPGSGSFLLGPQFRRHAAISQHCSAIVFFVPLGGQQVRVFAEGQLVGRYTNGDWSPENMVQVDTVVTDLAGQKGYDLALVQRILRCAFQMSEENLGAIFLIGNADLILDYADAPEISHFALIVSAVMDHLSDQELINFAKQDGATVIDVQGRFRGCMVLLRPGAQTEAEIGPGKGGRHSSAAKMSAEASCLAITVSQDGPITLYDSGRRILSL